MLTEQPAQSGCETRLFASVHLSDCYLRHRAAFLCYIKVEDSLWALSRHIDAAPTAQLQARRMCRFWHVATHPSCQPQAPSRCAKSHCRKPSRPITIMSVLRAFYELAMLLTQHQLNVCTSMKNSAFSILLGGSC
jgi:hypothetical protein